MSQAAVPTPGTPPASGRWLWLLPRLAFALFVASVAAQIWLNERADSEEERATLLNDVLWLEQTLRFNLEHNEESLARIGPDIGVAPFEANARALLDNKSGLVGVVLLAADGSIRHRLPAIRDAIDSDTLERAHQLGKPAYSPPYRDATGGWSFQVQMPHYRDGRYAGTTAAIYSLRRLLQDGVPWWLAQRNHISVLDLDGQVLTSRSSLARAETPSSHRMFFDPPGHGLVLLATPIRPPATWAGKFLPASLVLLAVLVVWSLWALRRDVQQRHAAEQALREEHAFRMAMENSLQTGLRARDLAGRITYVNPAFCRMVGWPTGELVGRTPPMPYWADEDMDTAQELNERILAGRGPQTGYEINLKRRNGETFPVLTHTTPLIDAQGRQTGWMSSIVDLTEQKRAEERERQQQERLQATARLVAMGEMASSLAHELNQPLAAISSYATGSLNLIDSGQADPAEIRSVLAKTQAQAQRAGQVIRRIYDFVRRAEPKTEPCDLARLVGETADLLEVDARRRKVRIVVETGDGLPAVEGDRVLLGQALFNLMKNGIEAMAESPDAQLTVQVHAEPGQVVIAIADRGPGIPAEAVQALFEPFYTTKSEGMGMGLNICRSIVEAHQGRLWLEPNPDGGSVFFVSLPISSERHDPPPAPSPPRGEGSTPPPPTRGEGLGRAG
ncbi:MAG: PAS domain S-box protein [Thiobacillus sp.]|nr:PAS domain S-box protein [Thiobacillus sp.]